jgi:hypothetical protein
MLGGGKKIQPVIPPPVSFSPQEAFVKPRWAPAGIWKIPWRQKRDR